jgi:hypothetical protein
MMTLTEIVRQLRFCHFECEGGKLEDNAAFRALERMANEEERGLRWSNEDYILSGKQSLRVEKERQQKL